MNFWDMGVGAEMDVQVKRKRGNAGKRKNLGSIQGLRKFENIYSAMTGVIKGQAGFSRYWGDLIGF